MKKKSLTGINIQYPISQLILCGEKTVETRTYPIPPKYLGQEMLMIETPGKIGKFKSRSVAIIVFKKSFQYKNSKDFYKDKKSHGVDHDSPWAWSDKKPKWGWQIESIRQIKPKSVDKRLGIKFTLNISR